MSATRIEPSPSSPPLGGPPPTPPVDLGPKPGHREPENDEVLWVFNVLDSARTPVAHLMASAAEGQFLLTVCKRHVRFSAGGVTMVWLHARRMAQFCPECDRNVQLWDERYQLRGRLQ